MDEHALFQQRYAAAQPATQRVLFGAAIWLLVMVILIALAFVVTATAPLGIHTHPPFAVLVVAHIFGALAATAGIYAALYRWTNSGVEQVWYKTTLSAVLLYVLTLSGIGWALPAVTTLAISNPTQVNAQVARTSSLASSRMGCRHRAYFGPWYATGGHICISQNAAYFMDRATLTLIGTGNSWATRVGSIQETRTD